MVATSRATVEERFQSDTGPVGLKVHRTEPEPAAETETEADEAVDVPEFNQELLAKMFANLTANGMTLEDLAG